MSAELLRRAATKLREHARAAAAADPPPWNLVWDNQDLRLLSNDGGEITQWTYGVRPWVPADRDEADRRAPDYMLLMHPPVAIALADVLEHLAGTVEGTVGDAAAADIFAREMTLAREILREAPDAT